MVFAVMYSNLLNFLVHHQRLGKNQVIYQSTLLKNANPNILSENFIRHWLLRCLTANLVFCAVVKSRCSIVLEMHALGSKMPTMMKEYLRNRSKINNIN